MCKPNDCAQVEGNPTRCPSYEDSVLEHVLMSRSSIKKFITKVETRIDACRNENARISSPITILSLIATIEAARAGEAGRGFGVVANKVRTLASQAATASEDLGGLRNELLQQFTGRE